MVSGPNTTVVRSMTRTPFSSEASAGFELVSAAFIDGDRALFFRRRVAKDRGSRNIDERILAQQAGDQKAHCRRLRGLEKLTLDQNAS